MIVPQAVNGKLSRDIIIGVATTTLIFAVSIYLPILGFFFSLLAPLPVLFYRIKLGRGAGGVVPIVTFMVMTAMMGGFSPDTLFFSGLILTGFALGEFFEMNLSVEKTILYSSGVVLLTGMIGLVFYSNFLNKGLVMLATDYVEKSMQLTVSLWETMEVPEERIHLISSYLKQIQYVLVRIIPALVVISTLFVTWATILITRPILKSTHLYTPDFGSLNLWRAPEPLVWAVIGCGVILLIPNMGIRMLGLNGMIILMMIYFFQGIAIVSFYFEKKHFPRMLRFFIYSMIAFQQMLLLLIVSLGFFDVWFDFRKLVPKKAE